MYIVTKQVKCSACNGVGVVGHPDWDAYWRKYPEDSPSLEIIRAFFSECGHDAIPPEEIKCLECEGSGIIESEVSLSEALADLGFDLSLAG